MPRWLWWMPLAVVTVLAGLLVFRMGYAVAHMTETDVINHYAARYVASGPKGAQVTDCDAWPQGGGDIWLIVRCGQGGDQVFFAVDRFGRLVEGIVPAGPQT